MDSFLLPAEIKARIKDISAAEPSCILRSSSDLNGSSGEAYVVFFASFAAIFSKPFSAKSYNELCLSAADGSSGMSLRKDKFNVFLDVFGSAGETGSLRLSSFDSQAAESAVAPFLKKGLSAPPASPVQAPPASPAPSSDSHGDASIETTPFVCLLASLLFAGAKDGWRSGEEDSFIKRIASGREAELVAARRLKDSCAPSDLASALASMEREVKLCIVSNLYELCLSDWTLNSSEQRFISDFAHVMGLSSAECDLIMEIVIAKNKASLLP